MIETLAVAPPQIRPSIEMNPEKKAEDDITSAYVRIVSINNEIKKNKIHKAGHKLNGLLHSFESFCDSLQEKKIAMILLFISRKNNFRILKI